MPYLPINFSAAAESDLPLGASKLKTVHHCKNGSLLLGKLDVDVYLLVIVVGRLLAAGVARLSALAISLANLPSVSPDRHYL
jgi:hypothetical protein